MKKLLLFLLVSLFGGVQALVAQPSNTLMQADGLFEQQRYGQAFELYEQIDQEGFRSPAMLLRMAFIKEGLGEYSEALYYLNRYYLLTYNRQVLNKMAELAEAQGLKGYNVNDFRLIRMALARNADIMVAMLAGIALLLMVLAAYQKYRHHSRPLGLVLAAWVFLAATFFMLNWEGPRNNYAILQGQTVYMMDGPSAGARLALQTDPGHRVEVEEAGEVWTKVEWEDREVWVRTRQLLTPGR